MVGVSLSRTRVSKRLTTVFGSFMIYLPILGGILSAMWYMIPLFYLSWYVIVFIFPIRYWDLWWKPGYDFETGFDWSVVFSFWIIEALLLGFGFVLFIYGLKTMVVHRTESDGLVTIGPYRWMRHPQHFGIILILLAPALLPLLPWEPEMMYIRPSDILSWSLIAFGLVVGADLEEISLSKRYGAKYDEYRAKVPFMIPFFPSLSYVLSKSFLDQGKLARYVLWFAMYWIIMTFILYLFSFVPLDGWR